MSIWSRRIVIAKPRWADTRLASKTKKSTSHLLRLNVATPQRDIDQRMRIEVLSGSSNMKRVRGSFLASCAFGRMASVSKKAPDTRFQMLWKATSIMSTKLCFALLRRTQWTAKSIDKRLHEAFAWSGGCIDILHTTLSFFFFFDSCFFFGCAAFGSWVPCEPSSLLRKEC